MRSKRGRKKAKTIAYRFIEPLGIEGKPIYERLQRILEHHHEEVVMARFALAWQINWKPDVDGRLTLGQCRKVSDLDREIVDRFDFIIVLNRTWWQSLLVTDAQRDALLDHECCHATVKYDETGELALDERGRTVYRLRKHDVEDFAEIVERHGCYKKDLEAFAAAIERSRAKSKGYVGYTSLRERLIAAGAVVQLDTITGWNAMQRHDADVWARVVVELKKAYPDGTVTSPAPDFVREAMLNDDEPSPSAAPTSAETRH